MTTTEYHVSKENQVSKINKVVQTIAHASEDDKFMDTEKREFLINKLSKVCNFINMQREGVYDVLDKFEFKGEYNPTELPHAGKPYIDGPLRKSIHLLFQELSEVIGDIKKNTGLTIMTITNEKLDEQKRKQLMDSDDYVINEINAIMSAMNEPELEKEVYAMAVDGSTPEKQYELQEEDIANNPDLAEAGLKAGDKVDIPVEILETMDLEKGSDEKQPEPTAPVTGNVPEGTGSVVVPKEEIEKQNASAPKTDRKSGKDLKK